MKKIFTLFCLLYIFTPLFGQDAALKKVAILEIVDKDGTVTYGVKLKIRSELGTAINNTEGFEAYDRVDIASIMNEQEFQRTGLVDATQIRKLGEMTGASYILVTEIAELDEKNIVILAKILDVESAQIEQTANMSSAKSFNSIEKSCRTIAERLLKINLKNGASIGELKIGDNVYLGEYKDGKPHGSGKMIYAETDKMKTYNGTWSDGVFDGYGTLIYNDGSMYRGGFKVGQKHGNGVYFFSADLSSYYDGSWENGVMNGNGRLIRNKRVIFNGDWRNGEKHGKGTEYDFYDDGRVNIIEATYDNGKKNGSATIRDYNGTIKKGIYINDKKEGKWNCYDKYNNYKCVEIYKNDKLIRTQQKHTHNKK